MLLSGIPEYIYQQYLKAFKKGVYNYIKEDQDPLTQQVIPRKYFSGGVSLAMTSLNANSAMAITDIEPKELDNRAMLVVEMKADPVVTNFPKGSGVISRPIKTMILTAWLAKRISSIISTNTSETPSSKKSIGNGTTMRINRRQLFEMVVGAAAAEGMKRNTVVSLFSSRLPQSPVLLISKEDFVDFFFANLTAERINFIERFFQFTNARGLDPPSFLSYLHPFLSVNERWAATLGYAYEYSQQDQFFNVFPDSEQWKSLKDFFGQDPQGTIYTRFAKNQPFLQEANFKRFAENLGVREYAIQHLTTYVGVKGRYEKGDAVQKEAMILEQIQDMFYLFRHGRVSLFRIKTKQLPSVILELKADLRMYEFGDILEQYLKEGRPALEKNPLFQEYLRQFYNPMRRMVIGLSNDELEHAHFSGLREDIKGLRDQWRVEQDLRHAQEQKDSEESMQQGLNKIAMISLNHLIADRTKETTAQNPIELIIKRESNSIIQAVFLFRNNQKIRQVTFIKENYRANCLP